MRRFWTVLLGVVLAVGVVAPGAAHAAAPAPSALSITPSYTTAVAGKLIFATGALTSGDRPLAGLRVTLMTREDRTGTTFHAIAGATTDEAGRYRFEFGAQKHLAYFVRFAGTADQQAAASRTVTLRVLVNVGISVTPAQPTRVVAGEVRQFSGTLARESKGKQIQIQTLTRGSWRTVAQTPVVGLNLDPRSGGYFRWSYRFSRPGSMTFRFVYPATRYQDSNVSRNLLFTVQRWHLLTDLTPSAASGVVIGKTDGRLGAATFPDSLKLTRTASTGSVSYDLRGGCSRFLGQPVVYRGAPRSHLVRFVVKVDGVSGFDATASMDKQLPSPVLGDITDKRTLALSVGGRGTGLVDLWAGAQILCSW